MACPVGKDTRPRDGEPIRIRADVSFHHRDVLFVSVVVVVRNVAGVAVLDLPWGVCVRVPYRFAFAVLVPCTFDLVRRCGRAPEKSVWKRSLPIASVTWPNICGLRGPMAAKRRHG